MCSFFSLFFFSVSRESAIIIMDNLKLFLGNVMTTTNANTPLSSANTRRASAGDAVAGPLTKPLANNQQQQTPNKYVAQSSGSSDSAAGRSFPVMVRNRTESESSMASDISSVSSAPGEGRLNKRKDSEPYFWIM